MDNTKKKELFPYFAYTYSKENNPSKYGGDMTFEEWYLAIEQDAPFLEEISNTAINLGEDAWNKLEKDYSESIGGIESAKNGAKLDKLKKLRATKKRKTISCSCGCDLISVKESGGTVKKCSCGCGK